MHTTVSEGWKAATRLVESYLRRPQRSDQLLNSAPEGLDSAERARCHHLFAGVLRNLLLLREAVGALAKKKPRPGLEALLLVAGFELLESDDAATRARVTDHGVRGAREFFSQGEAGFANAILRRMPAMLDDLPAKEPDKIRQNALRYSHPEWMVRRWVKRFGENTTEMLLQWNQTPPPVYVRLESGYTAIPDSLEETRWPHYFRFTGRGWDRVHELLQTHQAYVQDPSTRLPVELMDPRAGDRILDLCAAPGGKARQALARMKTGTLVALDLQGKRFETLQENLPERSGDVNVRLISADLRESTPELLSMKGLPVKFSAVLLDAPCTNSGVLRRRPDARWRLKEDDIRKTATLQLQLLEQAALFVDAGGRLIYSTCSMEAEENREVVDRFLRENTRFELVGQHESYPWTESHDGGAAYRLQRKV